MPTLDPTVLGIDPGARQIGVAVFRGDELIFYGLKSIKKKTDADTLRKLRKVLAKMIETYRIEAVAIEKAVFIQQQRSFVKTVYEEAVSYARTQKVFLFEHDPKTIRRTICGIQEPTKRNTALALVQSYPELEQYFTVPKIWQKRYYAQLFDAIAAGLVCTIEFKKIEIVPVNKLSEDMKVKSYER